MEALGSIRVLDLSHLGPGMLATMMLGDFGAEVISICSEIQDKKTPPKIGEDIWSFAEQMNLIQRSLNRNKKSVCLNLKSEEDRNLFYSMASEADIIVEDFRAGVAARLKIDYDTIRRFNPGIIYCSLSGYGQDGPYRDLPGHDINFIGLSGALDMIGEENGPPVVPMYFLADFAGAAMHATIGILTALVARGNNGEGQYIDISFVDSAMTLLNPLAFLYLNRGHVAKRGRTIYNGAWPYYSVYKCSDGKYITIGCFEPWLWENFCKAISLEGYAMKQFAEGEERDRMTADIRKCMLKKTRDEWFEFLRTKNVCVGRVCSLDETFEDPQIRHRSLIGETHHPVCGTERHLKATIRLSGTPARIRTAAPLQGENTSEIAVKYGKISS
ncbi:MAG: CaiB/BaiF CoA-transferase family protein [Syntrophales bacterium]